MRIEVNLLPASYYQAKRRKQMVLVGAAGGFVAICMFLGFNALQVMQLNGVKKQIADIEQQQKKYEAVLTEIQTLQASKQAVLDREAILKGLSEQQARWPRFLNRFVRAIPPTIQLKTLKGSGAPDNKDFTVTGVAISKKAVANFLERLPKHFDPFHLKNVRYITESAGGGLAPINFEMSFTVKL